LQKERVKLNMDIKLTFIKRQTFENKTKYEGYGKLKILNTVYLTYFVFIKYRTYISVIALLNFKMFGMQMFHIEYSGKIVKKHDWQ